MGADRERPRPPGVPFGEALRFWARLGFINFAMARNRRIQGPGGGDLVPVGAAVGMAWSLLMKNSGGVG